MSAHSRWLVAFSAMSVAAYGCAAADEGTSRDLGGGAGAGAGGVAGSGMSNTTDSSGMGFGNANNDTGRPNITVDPNDTPPVDTDMCESIGEMTEPTGMAAVDIVWVVDGSGSMVDEAERLQNEMDQFVMDISSAGVDTHVVLVGQNDLVPGTSQLAASGNYRFIQDEVDSHNALERLIARFPDYQDFLRPMAHVHFIVVTDDESEHQGATPQERANNFLGEMSGLLSNPYSVHAIASEGTPGGLPCGPTPRPPQQVIDCCVGYALTLYLLPPAAGPPFNCDQVAAEVTPQTCPRVLSSAAAPGVTYYELAGLSNGVTQSICQDDWTPVFGSLKDAVIESAPLPCNYAIPPAPSGMSFDRAKVNVKYTPTGADPDMVAPFGNVPSATDCGANAAWYYDNPNAPSEVLLCPASCDMVGSAQGGAIEVLFGCATVSVL